MNRGHAGLALVAILAAGVAGYWAGVRDLQLPGGTFLSDNAAEPTEAASTAAPAGPPLYYRDPDGAFLYAPGPRKNADGRDFLPVYAGEEENAKAAITSVASMSDGPRGARTVLYYRNPMGLPDTSPTPKKDSMGMDYIPIYAGEDADTSVVQLSPGKVQRTGVRSEAVTARVIVNTVRVPATVEIDERSISVVATRSEAFINRVADVTTGDAVKKGQPLLWLYSPDIAAASAQYLVDLKSNGKASSGARQRLENLGLSPETIDAIEEARKVPSSIPWFSPSDGLVVERNVVQGMMAAPGAVLFRVADLTTVWIVANVPEYDLTLVRAGAPAVVRVRNSGQALEGQIDLIYPEVSQDTRTTRVRIEIANPDLSLRPGMYADVEIASSAATPVIAVPDDAVIDSGTRQIVILDLDEGKFEPREVTVGTHGQGFTEIRKGLAEGDRIVVGANFLIDAESNLKAALSGMTGGVAP